MSPAPLQSDPTQRLEHLHEALESGAMRQVRQDLSALNAAEIADLLESLPHEQRQIIWKLVSPDDGGDVLVEVNDEVRNSLIKAMDSDALIAAATGLDIDDLADLLARLPETVNREVLRSLDLSDRLRLQSVLNYAEDSAGGLMNPDTITVRRSVSVEVILRYLRMRREIPDGTDALFVVDRGGGYLGCLFLTRLLTADPSMTAADLMDTSVPTLNAATHATEVAKMFQNYDLVSAPVVDDGNHLLGRITIDDVVDVIRDEASHSVMSMAGLDEDDDMFAPVAESARRRSIWLGVNLATAFLAAWAANLFEATLDRVVMLAILLPVVPSMGGIAGSQTLILITRGLALGQINRSNARLLLVKEFGVAVYNCIGWSVVVALVTTWWFDTWRIGVVIAAALGLNLVCAAVFGFFVPLALRRFRIDPALAGGVVLTTITDVVGIVAFLGLGTLLLL